MGFESPVNSEQGIGMKGDPTQDPTVGMIFQKYMEAKRFRKNIDGPWTKWERRYMGQHWDAPRPSWRSSPVANFIFSTIETILPIMTDHSPQISVIGAREDSVPIGDVFSAILQRIWTDNDMDLKLPVILKNSLIFGTGIAKVYWDPHRGPVTDGKPMGDVSLSIVDPKHFFVSPGATTIEDASYCLYAANVPTEMIERQYGVKIETPGIWEEDLTVNKTQNGGEQASIPLMGPIQSTDGSVSSWPMDNSQTSPQMRRENLCTLVELWYRKGDEIWCVMAANNQVLRPPCKPSGYNRFPFVVFIDYPIPGAFWGMGEVQQLEPLQDSINRRRGQTIDILRLTANPPLIADSDSGINPKALTTRPGLFIFKNRGSEIRWLQPPQLPAALFELQQLDKADLDAVSGVYDVTQGKKPSGIEAASAISELQEAAQTRIRAKVRSMEASLRQLGLRIVDLVQTFYDEPRTIRIVGGPASSPQFVQINQPQPQMQSPEAMQVQAAGRINDVTVGEFDVQIGVGSTMPVNKTRRFEQMLQLYQLQIVDAQAVLEYTGLSVDEIARISGRIQQAQQAQMQMQPQGQAAGQPAPAQGPAVPEPSDEELAMYEQQVGGKHA